MTPFAQIRQPDVELSLSALSTEQQIQHALRNVTQNTQLGSASNTVLKQFDGMTGVQS